MMEDFNKGLNQESGVKEETLSFSSGYSEVKPRGKKKILFILGLLLIVGSLLGAIYLVQQRQEIRKEAIRNQYQCVTGCDDRVCEAGDIGYSWCSKDKRCRCVGDGDAEPFPENEQKWCENNLTMYCSEGPPGSCGSKVDPSDSMNCGRGGTCTTFRDCVNIGLECSWPASTYCTQGTCACVDRADQERIAQERGWSQWCKDLEPKAQCLPNLCPQGWLDCGLGHARTDWSSECVAKVKGAICACDDCGNQYVVWRFCKPGGGPTTSPTPSPTIQCEFCKAYDTDWLLIPDLSTIRVGQTVFFTTRGTTNHPQGITKARFRINNSSWQETTDKHSEEFYVQYTISSPGSYVVEWEVFNPDLGWH